MGRPIRSLGDADRWRPCDGASRLPGALPGKPPGGRAAPPPLPTPPQTRAICVAGVMGCPRLAVGSVGFGAAPQGLLVAAAALRLDATPRGALARPGGDAFGRDLERRRDALAEAFVRDLAVAPLRAGLVAGDHDPRTEAFGEEVPLRHGQALRRVDVEGDLDARLGPVGMLAPRSARGPEAPPELVGSRLGRCWAGSCCHRSPVWPHPAGTVWEMQTLADTATRVLGGEDLMHAVRDFLDQVGRCEDDVLEGLVAERPDDTGDPHADALFAGLAEHLAATRDIACPQWVHEPGRFLDRFWFVSDVAGFRAVALAQTPVALKRRGIFWPVRSLQRV